MLRWFLIRLNGRIYRTQARSDNEAVAQARAQFPDAAVVQVADLPDEFERVVSYLVPVDWR